MPLRTPLSTPTDPAARGPSTAFASLRAANSAQDDKSLIYPTHIPLTHQHTVILSVIWPSRSEGQVESKDPHHSEAATLLRCILTGHFPLRTPLSTLPSPAARGPSTAFASLRAANSAQDDNVFLYVAIGIVLRRISATPNPVCWVSFW